MECPPSLIRGIWFKIHSSWSINELVIEVEPDILSKMLYIGLLRINKSRVIRKTPIWSACEFNRH